MNYNDHALSPVEDGWEGGQPGGPLANSERDPGGRRWWRWGWLGRVWIGRYQECRMDRTWSLRGCVHRGRGRRVQYAPSQYAKFFETCPFYTLWPHLYQYPHTVAWLAFFQPLKVPSSFPALGLCAPHSHPLPPLFPWNALAFSLGWSVSHHMSSREGSPDLSPDQLNSRYSSHPVSKIIFFLIFMC